MTKLVIYLNEKDFNALNTLAKSDLRDSNAEAIFIIRQELARNGLLDHQDPLENPDMDNLFITSSLKKGGDHVR